MFLASNKIAGPSKDFFSSTFLLKADWKLKILFALGLERRKKIVRSFREKRVLFLRPTKSHSSWFYTEGEFSVINIYINKEKIRKRKGGHSRN